MLDVLGGIRSACTYVGAGKLKEMSKRTTFIRFYINYHQQLIPKYPIWSQMQFLSQLLLLIQEVTSKAFEVAFF